MIVCSLGRGMKNDGIWVERGRSSTIHRDQFMTISI